MPVPIPDYVKNIARIVNSKRNWLTVSIHCECGCDEFFILANEFTKEQKHEIKQYEDEYKRVAGNRSPSFQKDEDGNIHAYIKESGILKEVTLPDFSQYASLAVYKARCSKCGNEYIIFDNSIHGYDSVIVGKDFKSNDFRTQFEVRAFKNNLPKRIYVKYENEDSLEEFIESGGEEVDESTYSNAFSWIEILAEDSNGKMIEIYTEETA